MIDRIVLTVAIPTWNRSFYLKQNLEQLAPQLFSVLHSVEILISDNCSTDESQDVVMGFIQQGLPIRYIRNAENLGSDMNIAQCFNEAAGQYVLILGDDDLLMDGVLPWLVERLKQQEFGVLCMRSFGFDKDFRKEYPGAIGNEIVFDEWGQFLVEIGALVTFISACVINKSLLNKLDAREFCGGSLVQVHLVIRAAIAAKQSLYVNRYLIACKRNNSGGYDFSQVFVEELGRILDQYLSISAKRSFETQMLLGYYPFYLFRQRLRQTGDVESVLARFKARFNDRWIYRILLQPILKFPRPLAVPWGAGVTLIGRIFAGDLRRGILFAWHRLIQSWHQDRRVL
jgi:glycosyltransferase involved in cell wall biosynthesis